MDLKKKSIGQEPKWKHMRNSIPADTEMILSKNTVYFLVKEFDDMGKKTMLRQLISKWGIMSIEMQKAFESDQAIIGENGEVNYIDNET